MGEIIFSIYFYSLLLFLIYNVFIPKEDYKYNYNIIIVLSLWFFAIMRGNGDGDYFGYIEYSKNIDSFAMLFNNKFPMEFGFRFVAFFTNQLNLHPQTIFLAMNSLISFILVYYFKMKENRQKQLYPLTLVLYLYFYIQFDIHATRTGVAMAFGLLFYKFLNRKSYVKAFMAIFLGFLFHKSSLVLVALPIIYTFNKKYKVNLNFKIFGVMSLLILIIDIPNLTIWIFEILGMSNYALRLSTYLNSTKFGYPIPLYDPRIIYFSSIVFYDFFRNKKEDNNSNILLNLVLQTNVIIILSFRSSTSLALRLSSYYSYLIIPFFTQLDIEHISGEYDKYNKFVYYILFLIMFGFVIILKIKLVPYKFFI